ncbi:MAG: hypothetical protein CMJ58_24580 [Planctomycetaceae bacterium]|nr:hypothetical protein [Planctomycetaceae bacterium]
MSHSAKEDHDYQLPAPRPPTEWTRQAVTASRPSRRADDSEGMPPDFVRRVLRNSWKWAIPLGLLLAAAAGCAVMYLHVPKYQASALIQIESKVPFVAFEQPSTVRDEARYFNTQIELLRGTVVLIPLLGRSEIGAMEEFQNEPEPLKHLQEHLAVAQIGESELYSVDYVSPSASDAATVANLVVLEYLQMQGQQERQRTQLVIDLLEQERHARSSRLEQLRRRVVELSREVTGTDPFGQGAVFNLDRALSPVDTLYQSLNEIDVNQEVLKAELQALNDAPIVYGDETASSGLFALEISNREDIRELESRLAAQRDRLTRIRKGTQKYAETLADVHDAQSALNERKREVQEELSSARRAERQLQRDRDIVEKKQELQSLATRRVKLAERLEEQLAELKSGGAQSAQLEFAKAELAREEKVFELIAARKLALQTELDAPDRITLKQSAAVPARPLNPIPYELLLVVCAASLATPFAVGALREVSVRRIATADDLERETALNLLGEVTRFPMRPVASRLRSLPAWHHREMIVFAESIDSLRTQLMLTQGLGVGGVRVLAVASAGSGEGKTSVATSLAVSFAKATQHATLIIDADLRAPSAARMLGLPNQPGLADVLRGDLPAVETIAQVGSSTAFLLPAGRSQDNPHHLLLGGRIKELFDRLQRDYALIVVDTPPVLAASESLVLARAADAVVLCLLSDVSQSQQVRRAARCLDATGSRIAGAVLSGVPMRRYTYAYDYRPRAAADYGSGEAF